MLYNVSVELRPDREAVALSLTVNNVLNTRPPLDRTYDGSQGFAPPFYNIFAYNGYGRAFWLQYRMDFGTDLKLAPRHGEGPAISRPFVSSGRSGSGVEQSAQRFELALVAPPFAQRALVDGRTHLRTAQRRDRRLVAGRVQAGRLRREGRRIPAARLVAASVSRTSSS